MPKYFEYGEKETNYLKEKDPIFSNYIDSTGHIYREVDDDLFSSLVHHIIGQQISTKAQKTIWERMKNELVNVDPTSINEASLEKLQSLGMTFKKAEYLKDLSEKIVDGSFDLDGLTHKDDEEAIKELSSLKGVGVWTAEMILLFCLERPNVFSYGDLAILRGLRMAYGHKSISRKRFEYYRKKFSPCCSVFSLYLWAIAAGAIKELKDPIINKKKTKRRKR